MDLYLSLLEKDINKIADSLAAKEFKKLCKNSGMLNIILKPEHIKPEHIKPEIPLKQKILIKIKKAP